MGVMIAGVDERKPSLYYIDDDGTRLQGNLFSVGSGSTFAYGLLDNFYHWDMTVKEAVDLGVRAISAATHRDSASGGVCRGMINLKSLLDQPRTMGQSSRCYR